MTKQSIDFTTLGDHHKDMELREAGRQAMPGIPIIARLDGRGFHKFTKGLERPFDENLTRCLQETTKDLIREFKPDIGYTQSDEITLVWKNSEEYETKLEFSGRYQKLVSLLSAFASLTFSRWRNFLMRAHKPELLAMFDCRVWQVANLNEACENLIWRELDAIKNSVSMAASSAFPHSELQGINHGARIKMLLDAGIDWNAYPDHFKKGSYFKKVEVHKELTEEELARIPEDKRPAGLVLRKEVRELTIPQLTKIANLAGVLFGDEEPVLIRDTYPVEEE